MLLSGSKNDMGLDVTSIVVHVRNEEHNTAISQKARTTLLVTAEGPAAHQSQYVGLQSKKRRGIG